MPSSYRSPELLRPALLVTYALLLPLILLEVASAHKLKLDPDVWRYSVNNGRLDYIDSSNFPDEVAEARYQWRQAGPIAVASTDSAAAADVRVYNINDCTVNYIGRYTYWDDRI